MSHVHVCTPEEAAAVLQKMGKANEAHPSFQLKGWVDAVCRQKDGGVLWEVHQPNLVTDYGRRIFASNFFDVALYLFTSPSTDVALPGRASLLDDVATTSSQIAAATSPKVIDAVTLTRSYTYTFGVPTGNRTVGTVGLCAQAGRAAGYGMLFIYAYTVLSPARIQTTTSTLEVTYKLTMIPTL